MLPIYSRRLVLVSFWSYCSFFWGGIYIHHRTWYKIFFVFLSTDNSLFQRSVLLHHSSWQRKNKLQHRIRITLIRLSVLIQRSSNSFVEPGFIRNHFSNGFSSLIFSVLRSIEAKWSALKDILKTKKCWTVFVIRYSMLAMCISDVSKLSMCVQARKRFLSVVQNIQ